MTPVVSTVVLAAHGSVDPRSPANTHAVAGEIRRLRPTLDVRVGFCERSEPNLRDVLAGLGTDARDEAIVAPLLLADAYHARVDIPALISESAATRARQADVLGEDPRLLAVLRERVRSLGVSPNDRGVGLIMVAVGSSWDMVNARTRALAPAAVAGTRWAGVTAFATGPRPTLQAAARHLRRLGATQLVIAPWFLAAGRLTDRVERCARAAGIPMAAPLGAHPLVAATVLDRFDNAVAALAAA
jgi:sirohydrochlorin ferrochelatase